MALDSAESTFDPFPLGDQLERVPDSSPLRVSLNTEYESGIPPARVRAELSVEAGEERLDLALASAIRTEGNLGQLIRGLKHLAIGAAAAREANLELTHELDELRAHLVHVHEEEMALRYRMAQLEQLLNVIRHESSREREFLIEQQDLFLVEIMTDHDRQIAELRHGLREAANRKADAPEVAELIAQRDQAREYATRCERERDLAWQELAAEHAPTLTPPPPSNSSTSSSTLNSSTSSTTLNSSTSSSSSTLNSTRKSGPTAIGSIALKAVQVSPDTERQPTGYSLSGDDISE